MKNLNIKDILIIVLATLSIVLLLAFIFKQVTTKNPVYGLIHCPKFRGGVHMSIKAMKAGVSSFLVQQAPSV